MFCPECRSEYREGIVTCSDCDLPLVGQLGLDVDSDELLTPLHISSNADLIATLAEAMETAGIPYVVTGGTGLALLDYADDGAEIEPQPWEGRIMVYNPMLEQAREILKYMLEQQQHRPVPNNLLQSH
jgi:predicted nucleotidyltransferase